MGYVVVILAVLAAGLWQRAYAKDEWAGVSRRDPLAQLEKEEAE